MRLLFVTTLLFTTASGFMVPTVLPVNVEQLVEKLPQMSDEPATPWLDFTANSALIPFIIYAPFTNAKATATSTKRLPIPAEDEIDYDAPVERQMKVDHIVRRQPFTLGLGEVGTITPPAFIQQAFDLYKPEHCFELSSDDMDEDYFSLVRDECYLGKDCTAKECVDFDPLHVHRKAPFRFMTPPLAGGY